MAFLKAIVMLHKVSETVLLVNTVVRVLEIKLHIGIKPKSSSLTVKSLSIVMMKTII